jgi:hypothetical protein
MATDKKHIAVYLDPAVERALIEFCEQKELKSKKGFMYSAGVSAALAEFFGITDTEESNTPQTTSNIPNKSSDNIPHKVSNIPHNIDSNIPTARLPVEVLPGKLRA